jgi:hypothetical protein
LRRRPRTHGRRARVLAPVGRWTRRVSSCETVASIRC